VFEEIAERLNFAVDQFMQWYLIYPFLQTIEGFRLDYENSMIDAVVG